jgi:hypothetical protein
VGDTATALCTQKRRCCAEFTVFPASRRPSGETKSKAFTEMRASVRASVGMAEPVANTLLPGAGRGTWQPAREGLLPSGKSWRLLLVNTGMPLQEASENHCTCAAVAGALVLALTLATPAAARAGEGTKAAQLLSKGIGFRFTTMHWAPGETGELHVLVPEHQFSVWMPAGIEVVKLPFP